MPANEASEICVVNIGALAGCQNVLDGSADIGCGVNQRAVYVKDVG